MGKKKDIVILKLVLQKIDALRDKCGNLAKHQARDDDWSIAWFKGAQSVLGDLKKDLQDVSED